MSGTKRAVNPPNDEDVIMNKDEIGGNWKQLKGKAKEQWGKLTDDDMTVKKESAISWSVKFRNGTAMRRIRLRKKSQTGSIKTTTAGSVPWLKE